MRRERRASLSDALRVDSHAAGAGIGSPTLPENTVADDDLVPIQ
jgi:hypothetical protein